MELEQLECVVCHHLTWQRITHKETNEVYPLCIHCIHKGWYNKEVFNVIMVRGEPRKVSRSLLDKLFDRN